MRINWELPLPPTGFETELADGSPVRVRPIRPDDAPALKAAFEGLSDRSRYLRFFSYRKELGDQMLKDYTDIDHHLHRAWVVADPSEPSPVGTEEGLGIGVARLFATEEDPTVAEATVVVIDEYQRRGVGRLLLDLLASTAALWGVERIRFETLWENRGLRRLMGKIGATRHEALSDREVIVYEIPVKAESGDITAGALYEILRWAAANREEPGSDREEPGEAE